MAGQGQWGNDATQGNNAPKWKMALGAGTQPGASANATLNTFGNNQLLFANNTANAVIVNQIVGIYGFNSNVISTGNPHYGASPGWNMVMVGAGPILNISVSAGGTGYTNGQYLTVSNSATGFVNAIANIATNSLGNVVSATLLSNNNLVGGKFFTTNTSLLLQAVANGSSNGPAGQTGATFSYTFGGRAGRINISTLVVVPSMTGNTANPYLPNVN